MREMYNNNSTLLHKYGHDSTFQISLEAWRRGLTVTFNKDTKKYKISSVASTCNFHTSALLTETYGRSPINICQNKNETKEYLKKAGIRVPEGKRFDASISDEEIVEYAEKLGYPVVLKPTFGEQGKGVFSNIQDNVALKNYLNNVRCKLKFKDVVIEEHIQGDDLRILVIGEKAIAVMKRIPANVTGDGINSIRDLISVKNNDRKNNPYLSKGLINIDREVNLNIQDAGYSLNSILPQGKVIYLRNKCNLSTGGESIDVNDVIPINIKNNAVKAVKAIPGLRHAGVDILYNVNQPDNSSVVIEINAKAHFALHLYPSIGSRQEVVVALIDHYFPESVNNKGKNNGLFYDMKLIRSPLTIRAIRKVYLKLSKHFKLPLVKEKEVTLPLLS